MISTDAPTPCQDNPYPFDAVLDKPSKANVEAAKRICASCQIREACVTDAIAHHSVGVYGGRLLLGKGRPNWIHSDSAMTCGRCGTRRTQGQRGWAKGKCRDCYNALYAPTLREGLNSRGPVDELKVQRATDGHRDVVLNIPERVAAVGILARRGLSDRQIGYVLGFTSKTALRIRHRAQIPAALPRTGGPS